MLLSHRTHFHQNIYHFFQQPCNHRWKAMSSEFLMLQGKLWPPIYLQTDVLLVRLGQWSLCLHLEGKEKEKENSQLSKDFFLACRDSNWSPDDLITVEKLAKIKQEGRLPSWQVIWRPSVRGPLAWPRSLENVWQTLCAALQPLEAKSCRCVSVTLPAEPVLHSWWWRHTKSTV